MQESRTVSSKITFLITLIIVSMLLVAVIFPGLYHSIFVDYEIKFESPFELGHKAYLLIGSNILLFAFGIIYYKNKFPFLTLKIDQIRKFEISKKISKRNQ